MSKTPEARSQRKVGDEISESEYGRYYWRIKLTDDQELSVCADRVEIAGDGVLVFYGGGQTVGAKFVNLTLSPGSWQYAYAIDPGGRPLAVEQRQGRRPRGQDL